MAQLKQLEDYKEQMKSCVKCGACRAHCPAFGAVKHEGRVARGKIALADALLKDEVDLEERFLLDMSQCLLCGSCYTKCPNKVPTEEIVAATRRRIAEKKGLSSFGKAIAAIVRRPMIMDLLAQVGRVVSPLFLRKIPENSGLHLRFPTPVLDQDRTLPQLAAKPFRDQFPEILPGREDRPRVLFFTGCAVNYLYPHIGEALVTILQFLGITLIIPQDQGCCGLPALSAGAGETVEALAEKNAQAIKKHRFDCIVTACASCNSSLAKLYPGMGVDFAESPLQVKDIVVFLVEQGLVEKLHAMKPIQNKVRVTYHDPCHLRSQGITKEPRMILEALPQVDFVEMAGAGTCCGLGGTYSVYHYETSKVIGAKKATAIADSGADLVATDCPGCIMQLQDSINHAGGQQQAVHLLDLIVEALAPEEAK